MFVSSEVTEENKKPFYSFVYCRSTHCHSLYSFLSLFTEAQQPPSMKPEIENQPTGKGQGDECDSNEVNVINRVAALPMVSSTLTQMTNAYNWSKDKNSLVKYTLEMAESGVSMAASTAQPVVNRLGGPSKIDCDLVLFSIYFSLMSFSFVDSLSLVMEKGSLMRVY